MVAKLICEHGITPKSHCRTCVNTHAKQYARNKYSPEKAREGYIANRGKVIVINLNSRAKRYGVPGIITLEYYEQLAASPCIYCGSTKYIEADHKIPITKGGTNYPENVQPVCRYCNRSKGFYGEANFLEWLNAIRA